jgi:protein-tyrosine phosphatase
MIREGGTDAVVLTPHFYANRDTLSTFLARRRTAAQKMLLLPEAADMQLFLGAEVLVCPGLQHMEGLEQLAIVGTNILLLEMPFRPWDDSIIETVEEIRERGLCPILAHIDRYDSKDVHRLLRKGFAAQMNADSLAGFFAYRKNARYFKTRAVVALGSDLHGAEHGGYRHFLRAKKRLGNRASDIFASSATLLAKALPLAEAIAEKEPVPV